MKWDCCSWCGWACILGCCCCCCCCCGAGWRLWAWAPCCWVGWLGGVKRWGTEAGWCPDIGSCGRLHAGMCCILHAAGNDHVGWPVAAQTGIRAAVVHIGMWGPVQIGMAYGAIVTGAAACTCKTNQHITHWQTKADNALFTTVFFSSYLDLLPSLFFFRHNYTMRYRMVRQNTTLILELMAPFNWLVW